MSFKHKLLLYFVLLALVPIAVSFYGYDTLASRSETQRADARLAAELRAAVAAYSRRVQLAAATATHLAQLGAVQKGLVDHDRTSLRAAIAGFPNAAIRAPTLAIGRIPAFGVIRRVTIRRRGRILGTVIVSAPIDSDLLHSLSAGLSTTDRLVAIRDDRVLVGTGRGSITALTPGEAARTTLAGTTFRGLETSALKDVEGVRFAVLTPHRLIDESAHSIDLRLGATLAGSLVVFGLVTYLLGRSIVITLRNFVGATDAIVDGRLDVRVEQTGSDEFGQLATAFTRMAIQLEQRPAGVATERRRVHEVATGFGHALAATHDETSLLRVVVESAVQATGGTGGIVTKSDAEIARVGDPSVGAERLFFPLRAGSSDYGTLVLYGNDFETEGVELAATLARQAVIALENARLHRVVEKQALVDSLTGLANRRMLDETLRLRLAHVANTGRGFTLVLADLDRFKAINDRYGHPFGDRVLVTFAGVLRSVIRNEDVAGRWGGEEFALILTEADAGGATILAERARAAFQAATPVTDSGDVVTITASFGIASYPESASIAELVQAADSALYSAKRAGGNRVFGPAV